MPRYLFEAVVNALRALREGDVAAAIVILEFVIREVKSGRDKLVEPD